MSCLAESRHPQNSLLVGVKFSLILKFLRVLKESLFMSLQKLWGRTAALTLAMLMGVGTTLAQDYPPLEKVTEGYKEIAPDGSSSFYRIWYREKDNQLLAELPKDYASQHHFIALTVSGGQIFAGLQADDYYVYWRKFNNRLALISKNLNIKSTGDQESKDSVKRLFTDQVLLDLPILTMVPRGGPVIDLDELLVRRATVFFGGSAATSRPQLAKFKKPKVFPENVELTVEYPTSGGTLRSFHYSFSLLKPNKEYRKRLADERIGYFTTSYSDYGKYSGDETSVHYINRWHLQKAKPELKLSPPKKRIVFYIEHTTPVRYRRWVRQGILNWNKAFEQVGIINAIEVYQQDKASGDYMDLQPEDVRYNFIRWLNNDVSTAIGPSRVDPNTGQILDADIVLTDGWIRAFERQFDEVMPKVVMEGMSAETLDWLSRHPNWDPRIRLAPPSQRKAIRSEIERKASQPYAGHDLSGLNTKLMGDEELDGLFGRTSQKNGGCMAAEGRAFDVAMMRMMVELKRLEDEEDGKPESDEQKLDGMPESFIGPLLADLVCHEVGHTLGLRHNFKASSIYSFADINSEKLKGKQPFAGSVMDYLPVNFNFERGEVQGDWAMIGIGPYDMWAIQYGYEPDEKKLPEILKRVAEPELVFATDQDTSGPDPLARRYDFSKNPLDYAKDQLGLAKHHREKILEKFVEDGDSWTKARRGYEMTLRMQVSGTSMMSNWIGGSFVNRDKKGDPNGRVPVQVVPAEQQREALKYVINNTFFDEVYGLKPELLNHMTADTWLKTSFRGRSSEPTWPVHDRIMGIQASALTQILDPTKLRRVYDNEFRVPSDEEALTLFELMDTVTDSVWKELDGESKGKPTVRKPLISSLRRNLQTEHLVRLFDLANEQNSSTAALRPIANLSAMTLKELADKIDKAIEKNNLDPYSKAHLFDAKDRIQRWMDDRNNS